VLVQRLALQLHEIAVQAWFPVGIGDLPAHREHVVRLIADDPTVAAKFAELADSLLVGGARSSAATGTRVFAALQAYEKGHEARVRWDLPTAEDAFDRALQLDPAYTGDGSDLLNVATGTSDTTDPNHGNDPNPPARPIFARRKRIISPQSIRVQSSTRF